MRLAHFPIAKDSTRNWIPYGSIDSLILFKNSNGDTLRFSTERFFDKHESIIINEQVSRRCTNGDVQTCKKFYTSETEGVNYKGLGTGFKLSYFITKEIFNEVDMNALINIETMGIRCVKFNIDGNIFYLQNNEKPTQSLSYTFHRLYMLENQEWQDIFIAETKDRINKDSQVKMIYYSFKMGLMGFTMSNGETWTRL